MRLDLARPSWMQRPGRYHGTRGPVAPPTIGSVSAFARERTRPHTHLQPDNLSLREDISETPMFEEIVGASAALQGVLASFQGGSD